MRDALFSAGWSRVHGKFAQMFESVQSFNQLMNETVVCPLMNTLGNLAFAETVWDKSAVKNQRVLVNDYRAEGIELADNN